MLDLSVGRKLALFRKMDVISTEDYHIVCQFKEMRNNLFHKGGIFFLSIQNEEKEKIMSVGERAVDIMEKLVNLLGERQGGRYVYLKKENESTYDK